LMALPADERPGADQLSFVLLGDPNNPDGGMLSRFDVPGLPAPTIPSLGVTFNGATPAETPWDTAIYTTEYDGFADFPKYPINLLADLNALAGILTVHGAQYYLTDAPLATAIRLPVSADYDGDTTYWMIPTEQLPLTELIAMIPVVGQPLADLLEPDLRVLVNLGYGSDPDVGWSTTGANLPTPFGLFPSLDSEQFNAVLQALATGAQQGFEAFVGDLSHLSLTDGTQSASDMANLFDTPDPSSLPSLTDIVNALSGAVSSAYATLLPTADIVNALITTLPAFDISLFFHELMTGDLLDAVGLPVAATVGLTTIAIGFELFPIANALADISADLGALF
ncbi:MAG: PE-PPE domain-containing protein, partial [Mycobacterium sp.]